MTELMMQITSWIVAAMLLGFLVAWFLSRDIYRRKERRIEDMFDAVILERNNMIDNLEKDFRKEREVFERVSYELKDTKERLAEKTLLATTLQTRLDNSASYEKTIQHLKEENSLFSTENKKLKEVDRKRISELKNFEEILLLAEDKIEESEKSYFKIVENLNAKIDELSLKSIKYEEYKKRIKKLEEELKLYKAESVDPEFIITRDQFIAVEDQLIKYQDKINSLQNVNQELLSKLKKSDKKLKV